MEMICKTAILGNFGGRWNNSEYLSTDQTMMRVYQLTPALKEKSNLWGHTWRMDEPIGEINQPVRDKQWQVSPKHDHTRDRRPKHRWNA